MPRKRSYKGICPRCGAPFSWTETYTVGDREYVYAVHYQGKGKIFKCYLGPKDGYVFVTMTHRKEGLQLKGLCDPERILEYFERILKLILSNERLREEVRARYGALIRELW